MDAMEKFVLLLAPFAPHIAEELWQLLGHAKTLAYEPWPETDERWLKEDTVEMPVQVNGKLRGKITVPAGSDQGGHRSGRPRGRTVSPNWLPERPSSKSSSSPGGW